MTEQVSKHTHPSVAEIDREGVRARLARAGDFKLVMAARPWAFRAKHIPGSVYFETPDQMFAGLGEDDEIVVYRSNVDCHASLASSKISSATGVPATSPTTPEGSSTGRTPACPSKATGRGKPPAA